MAVLTELPVLQSFAVELLEDDDAGKYRLRLNYRAYDGHTPVDRQIVQYWDTEAPPSGFWTVDVPAAVETRYGDDGYTYT